MNVVIVGSHYYQPEEIQEYLRKYRVVSIGWKSVGDLSKLTKDELKNRLQKLDIGSRDARTLRHFRDKIEKGDLVFSYVGKNIIGMVGIVSGPYKFVKDNEISRKFGHPHQRKVDWWSKPILFERDHLPSPWNKRVSIIGTLNIFSVSQSERKRLEKVIKSIPSGQPAVSESEIKSIFDKYGFPEFVVKKREHQLRNGIVDYLAKDQRGRTCLIEVKTRCDGKALEQAFGYGQEYWKKCRLVLIAGSFSKNSKIIARKLGIDLYKCVRFKLTKV